MKTLLVTGASRGIGRFLADSALAHGYGVVGLARNFPDDAPFETLVCDVRDAAQLDQALERFKGDKSFYGVINAAGILNTKAAVQYGNEEIADLISTNLISTIQVSKRVARFLLPLRHGRIINISSIAAHAALKGDSVYSATKAGIEVFSRALAREVAERGITVNCIAPGPIATDMTRNLTESQLAGLIALQILPRQIAMEELWPVVCFLLSEGSGVVTGEVLHIGGV
jgi:3-oxoacyl-[acyl-carrier protein] reductase